MENKLETIINNVICFVVVTLVSVGLIYGGYRYFKTDMIGDGQEFYSVTVLDAYAPISDDSDAAKKAEVIPFLGKFTSGYREGDTMQMEQYFDPMFASQPRAVEKGDKIIVTGQINDSGDLVWTFVEFNRLRTLAVLAAVFFLIILIIGRAKGIATIVSLVLTCGAVFLVYLPAILSGFNIYLITTLVAVFIILMSLLLINGANTKTLCAVIGNVGGVLFSGILALAMSHILEMTGVIKQDYVFLMYLDAPINLIALIWGGIVIGALGAVMDVAMSIASSMNELSLTMRDKSFKNMVKSGMNIGKDAIGTMTNTLILAYIGSSLATVLLLVVNNSNVLYLLNMEMIVAEILQALAGSMGILFAVPSTVFVSAYLYNRIKPAKRMKKLRTNKEAVSNEEILSENEAAPETTE